jgi:protein SCO1/2
MLILVLTLFAVVARADDAVPPQLQDVGVDEKPDAQFPLDLTFTNEMGRPVTLRDCMIPGKPAVLQLGYFGCPMLCDTVSQGLLRSMQELDLNIGSDFSVIYLSIDPRETRYDAYLKKEGYIKQYTRAGAGGGWHFLVGTQASVKAVASAIGFKFKWIESQGQFAHPAVLMILTPEGRVSRYLYGVEYPERTLRLSLVEASEGKIGTTVDRVMMFCYRYDAKTGSYTFAAWGLMRLGGLLTILVLGTWIVRYLIRERRALRAEASAAPPGTQA